MCRDLKAKELKFRPGPKERRLEENAGTSPRGVLQATARTLGIGRRALASWNMALSGLRFCRITQQHVEDEWKWGLNLRRTRCSCRSYPFYEQTRQEFLWPKFIPPCFCTEVTSILTSSGGSAILLGFSRD